MLFRAESINEIAGHDYIHLLQSKCCRLFQEDSEALSKLPGWIGAMLSPSESRKGKMKKDALCLCHTTSCSTVEHAEGLFCVENHKTPKRKPDTLQMI